jgi:hypothetical protein
MSDIETEEKCPLCHALVCWRLSITGRRLRLDVDPDPSGNVIVIETNDGKIRAQVLTGDQMPAQQEAWRQHTCATRERPGPPCSVCRLPMHRELARRLRWTTHPACEPEFLQQLARETLQENRRAS